MEAAKLFSKAELNRYNRHIIIPGFGLMSQEKLKNARVLVVGAGGLGSPVLLYLAAAGIGTIGIVDGDVVEDSNLHRQVLYSVEEIGMAKTKAAKARLESLNPYLNIMVHPLQLTAENAEGIITQYDVVADGTDNFPTRYLVNDACVLFHKTNVYASIYQFEGQVSVFNALHPDGSRGPNYRDLYPEPPEPGVVANCSEAGVLGVLPGIIGSLQALEVIKVVTGVGDILSERLYTFDALSFESRIFNLTKNPGNPLTGRNPAITGLIDYEQFCGVKAVERAVKQVSAADLYAMQVRGADFQLIDVREKEEYDRANIGGELIPLGTIVENAGRIKTHKKTIIICRSGNRSALAIRQLEDAYGFSNLYNLEGGLSRYFDELELDLPIY
ncbi:molybdopterin-synthase adenylyltransferase MoeB [Pedobacter sp. AW31-3R]|uniref:molybdopterin-synthase adenylyltransferase MoeB n=1 Tax=Pedobacter sp. AW31-3R TaxID=3445781 RepID=UPI003FA16BCB